MRKLIETECATCGASQSFQIDRAGYSSAEYTCPNCGRGELRSVRLSPDLDAEHDPDRLAAKLACYGVPSAAKRAREQIEWVEAGREGTAG